MATAENASTININIYVLLYFQACKIYIYLYYLGQSTKTSKESAW